MTDAPTYDLTYSTGPNGQHSLAANVEATVVGADAVRTLVEVDVKPRRLAAFVGGGCCGPRVRPEIVSKRTLWREVAGYPVALSDEVLEPADLWTDYVLDEESSTVVASQYLDAETL